MLVGVDAQEGEQRGEHLAQPAFVRACSRCAPHAANWLFTVSTRPRYRCNPNHSPSVFAAMFLRRRGTSRIPVSPSIHASSSALL